jgi:hypothetical protein
MITRPPRTSDPEDMLDYLEDIHNYLNLGVSSFTNADTTPDVSGGWRIFSTANTGGTTITTFDKGYPGQAITIIFTDANTTISEANNIKLSAAFTSTADDTMSLVYDGTNWYELSRSVN